jgi:thermitase
MDKKRFKASGFITIFLPLILILLFTGNSLGLDNPLYVSDELLIQPKAGVSEQKLKELLKGVGSTIVEEIPQIRVKRIKVPPHAFHKIMDGLSRNPHIKYVEPNFIAKPEIAPNDSYYSQQWHLPKISAPQAWDISVGSSIVPIAVLDTGVDPTHPDLASKLLSGYNFYDGNTDTRDVYGHGTAVAGVAAALSNNSFGVTGIAWNNPIMPLRISAPDGWATYSAMASAITYAVDKGVRVINLSYGGTSSSTTLQNAVNYAWNKGAIVFASAGNSSTDSPTYPAACTNAVAISATTSNDLLASFSNYGNWIDLSAPGSGIYTTLNGGGYGYKSGTSFSAPIAAGLAALIISANPSLSNKDVVDIMKMNADDLGSTGFDPYYGYGRINNYRSLLAAVNSISQPDIEPPVVSILSPSDSSIVSGMVTLSVSAKDDSGVVNVDLYINGKLYSSDNTEPYNFFWDTTVIPNGTYYIEALAFDRAGNSAISAIITLYVNNQKDLNPPSVIINSPANGSYVNNLQKINVSASDDTSISKLELYIDGVLKASTNSSSLSFTWNTKKIAKGSHSISAKAYDSGGNEAVTSIEVYK